MLAGKGHLLTLLIDPCDADKLPAESARSYDVIRLSNSGHYDLVASWKARWLIRERRIDAVIAHSGRAIHMLKRAAPERVPVIAFNHSHNIGRTLKADAFFCITPYMKKIVDEATGAGKPSFVISNAVTVPPVEALAARDGGIFTVGAIARMVPNKGLHHLLAALGLLAQRGVDFRARTAGDGEQRAALTAMASKLGLGGRIEFLGWIGADEKAGFFNSIDVMCFTSESDIQGITILESFAWAKPLIGTDVDGPSSCYEDEETALVVPPRDPEALARALIRLQSDPMLRARLATNGRAAAIGMYSNEVIADQLDTGVRAVIAGVARHEGYAT